MNFVDHSVDANTDAPCGSSRQLHVHATRGAWIARQSANGGDDAGLVLGVDLGQLPLWRNAGSALRTSRVLPLLKLMHGLLESTVSWDPDFGHIVGADVVQLIESLRQFAPIRPRGGGPPADAASRQRRIEDERASFQLIPKNPTQVLFNLPWRWASCSTRLMSRAVFAAA